jgi:hypothetical protein
MNKNLFSLILIFAVSFAFCQEKEVATNNNSTGASFYVKAGANIPFYSGEIAQWDGKVSYHLGVGLDISLSEKFSIAPELVYYKMEADWDDRLDELNLSMISIPLLAKYKFTDKFELELGPQLLYISNVERTRNYGISNEKPNGKVNDFDFGVTGGLSYFFTNKFGVNARYYFGLTEVDDRPGIYLAYTDSDLGKISFASLSLVYKL